MTKAQLISTLEEALQDRREALKESLQAQCLLVPHFYDGMVSALVFALSKARELEETRDQESRIDIEIPV